MRQWRHEPPAPNFWAKKSAPHSDSVQILEVINLYNCTVSVRLRLIQAYAVVCRIGYIDIIFPGEDLKTHTFPNHF